MSAPAKEQAFGAPFTVHLWLVALRATACGALVVTKPAKGSEELPKVIGASSILWSNVTCPGCMRLRK
jgi:hypothetical protein